MKPRHRIFVGVGSVVCVASLVLVALFIRYATQVPLRAYATQGAAELVVWHLRLHTNQWPRNWEDLEVTHATLEREHSQLHTNDGIVWRTWDISIASTMEDMRRRIEIDWHADVNTLREASLTNGKPTFRVVRLKDGKTTHWEGLEPNRMIWDYLQSAQTNPPPYGVIPR